MKKSILEIYALAVCFATIVCFVIALGIALYDVIEISNPEFTLSSHEYNRHQSNDAFWKNYQCGYDKKDKEMQRPSDEELSRQRLESYQQAVKSERRDAFQGLTRASIILTIDIFIFLVHWRVALRARETNIAM
ncbi:MAG: hypothetical protein AB1480_02595 [Nitrospirota bacterium]